MELRDGYGWLDGAPARAVHNEALTRPQSGALRPTSIRRAADRMLDMETRGDFISWVRSEQGSALSPAA